MMFGTKQHIAALVRRCGYIGGPLLLMLMLSGGEMARLGGQNSVAWWADGGWTLCGLLATGGCLQAARQGGSGSRAWLFFAGGCASWLAGQLIWNYFELLAHTLPPFPSWDDVGYLGFTPCFVAGVI